MPIGGCTVLIASLFALTMLMPGTVLANDTTAELATGGLIFTKSPHIEMRSEDLFISMTEIRVQYNFFNPSNRDIITQVAFPIPDLPYAADTDLAIPTNDPENILGFTTTVNNLPVAALVERKALLNGVDKTEELRRLGVSVVPKLNQNYSSLSQEAWDELIRDGLIEDAQRADGYIKPRWTLKTTYYWQQTFPAGREVSIAHRYAPSVGGVVPMPTSDLLKEPSTLQIDRARGLNRFCIDQEFLNEMVRSPRRVWEQRFLEYILTTGANWSGPIKSFRLTIEKGAPENLVSFCGQGVRKTGPTKFQLHVSDFVPHSNLSVLFLIPHNDLSTVPDAGSRTDMTSLSCDQLWFRRNSIFKSGGYCFRSSRAIASFGNAGCKYDEILHVPLSDRDRQSISVIRAAERSKGCPP